MDSDWETKHAVEQMRNSMFYMGVYRDRAQALGHLATILRCETPGTVSDVVVKRGRWWRRDRDGSAPREIVLTDDERREFRDWCEERAESLRARADEIEAKYALPAAREGDR